MTRRGALRIGAVIASCYVASVALSARSGQLVGAVMLDGLAPLSPYRWVDPPQDSAASTAPPLAGRGNVRLTKSGSVASAVSTRDTQATVVLPERTFETRPSQDRVRLTIKPLSSQPFDLSGSGLDAVGNVYLFAATYEPAGTGARLVEPVFIQLTYPVIDATSTRARRIAFSRDGKRWRALSTTTAPAQQRAQAKPKSLGYFVVGQVASASIWSWLSTAPLVAAAVVVLLGAMVAVGARRASHRSSPTAGRRE
jgi:hypothetical protein